jgi:SHS2 domain-containing protein
MPTVPSHSFVDHVGEVCLELRAPTLTELFAEAGRALAELLHDGRPNSAAGPFARLAVRARDREALLVAWMNELIYLSETGHAIYNHFLIERITDEEIVASARSLPVDRVRTAVKAATFHDLRLQQTSDGFTARVVLDV